MAKKKYFRKKAVLKAITKYHRRKLNFVTDVYVDNDNKVFIDGQETNSLIIGEILSSNTGEFQVLGKQYAFVKLRGISIETVPYLFSGRYNAGLSLGQANDSLVFNNIRTQPNILLINNNDKSRIYCKISSEFTSTNSIELSTYTSVTKFNFLL